MVKKPDRRIQKTKNAIQSSLKELLLENKNLDQISVKMICDRANIGRKTFYSHYSDKFALMDEFMDSYLNELKLTCQNLNEENFHNKIEIWIKFFIKNRDFFRKLFESNDSYQFREKFNHFTKEQLLFELRDSNKLTVDFLCYGIDGIIEHIVLKDGSINEEKLLKEISQILNPYFINNK
ncbi:TetR/AcrR family transcriptional regulator [Lactobacillus acetotolerans]|uniref:TetR/AcrR family transcriptional regulator n=2 Tax=Lactobacillus acetotolerans TaxID=1600 RepID=UPI0007BA10AB|nr:TetR-like C-terminal domain-containing protein [Lactobacillus acetotolerans]QGV04711.1 TetR family transcriptional regulator [Lactobacillus acetotolerans]